MAKNRPVVFNPLDNRLETIQPGDTYLLDSPVEVQTPEEIAGIDEGGLPFVVKRAQRLGSDSDYNPGSYFEFVIMNDIELHTVFTGANEAAATNGSSVEINFKGENAAVDYYEANGFFSNIVRNSKTGNPDLGNANVLLTGFTASMNQDSGPLAVTDQFWGFNSSTKVENGTVRDARAFYDQNLIGTSSGRDVTIDYLSSYDGQTSLGVAGQASTIGDRYFLRQRADVVVSGSSITGTNRFLSGEESSAESYLAGPITLDHIEAAAPNWPTTDPAVAGRLWVDAANGNVVKRSTG